MGGRGGRGGPEMLAATAPCAAACSPGGPCRGLLSSGAQLLLRPEVAVPLFVYFPGRGGRLPSTPTLPIKNPFFLLCAEQQFARRAPLFR